MGRLYPVDMRLRPTGKSGSLVTPLAEFRRYYAEGGAQLWERQALTRARVVCGDAEFGREVMVAVEQAVHGPGWRPELVDEILTMRERMEASRSERDLKRGFGGIVDVEFVVQLLQLKHGSEQPVLRRGNTWEILDALLDGGFLPEDEYRVLRAGYDFLRLVESRQRIVHNRTTDELPESPEDVEKLARRLGYEPVLDGGAAGQFLADLEEHTSATRTVFLRLLEREKRPASEPEGYAKSELTTSLTLQARMPPEDM
jgi:glutamate-ammonia-ligase adenylyltransferase